MFDTGADDVVIPKRVIPAHLLKRLQRSKFTISGVNSEREVLGEFCSELDFSGIKFPGIRILVTDESEAPPLIGRTVIDHATNVVSAHFSSARAIPTRNSNHTKI